MVYKPDNLHLLQEGAQFFDPLNVVTLYTICLSKRTKYSTYIVNIWGVFCSQNETVQKRMN